MLRGPVPSPQRQTGNGKHAFDEAHGPEYDQVNMKAESIVFAIAGVFFGLIVGWVLGTQQASGGRPVAPLSSQQTAATAPASGQQSAPPALDQAKVQALETVARNEAANPAPRVQLANLYFDAERYN